MPEHKDFHEYKGKRYISVTTALSIINNEDWNRYRGFVGNEKADLVFQYGCDVGKLVHKYCAMIARKKSFDIPMLDDPVKSIISQVQEWFDENVKKVISTEKRYFNDSFSYCGTIDLLAKLKSGGVWLIDYKTGAKIGYRENWQLAAYIKALAFNKIIVDGCILLRIPKGGKLKPVTLDMKKINSYFTRFLTAKQLYYYINEK